MIVFQGAHKSLFKIFRALPGFSLVIVANSPLTARSLTTVGENVDAEEGTFVATTASQTACRIRVRKSGDSMSVARFQNLQHKRRNAKEWIISKQAAGGWLRRCRCYEPFARNDEPAMKQGDVSLFQQIAHGGGVLFPLRSQQRLVAVLPAWNVVSLLLPANKNRVQHALSNLKCYPLLQGYRGRPKCNIDSLVKTIIGLAEFAESNADSLLEMDINPLMVLPEHAVAADALLRTTA